MAYNNEQVANLMKLLGVTEDEAKQIIDDDKAIDQGKPMDFDLQGEKAEVAKKLSKGVSTYKKQEKPKGELVKRNRKENPAKAEIIQQVYELLMANGYENVEITNKERQIAFSNGENKFEFTLVQKKK